METELGSKRAKMGKRGEIHENGTADRSGQAAHIKKEGETLDNLKSFKRGGCESGWKVHKHYPLRNTCGKLELGLNLKCTLFVFASGQIPVQWRKGGTFMRWLIW